MPARAVRTIVQRLVGRRRRRRAAGAIVDCYRRRPQREHEVDWPDSATKRMIADEPW